MNKNIISLVSTTIIYFVLILIFSLVSVNLKHPTEEFVTLGFQTIEDIEEMGALAKIGGTEDIFSTAGDIPVSTGRTKKSLSPLEKPPYEGGETELELEFKWSAPDKKQRPGKFELYQSASDQWYFRLKAPNGEIILSSEGYATKRGAANGIESVKKNAQPENIEHRTSKAGQPYFVLKAANNQIIGTSQMYKRQSSANKGAQSVVNHAPTATTTEE